MAKIKSSGGKPQKIALRKQVCLRNTTASLSPQHQSKSDFTNSVGPHKLCHRKAIASLLEYWTIWMRVYCSDLEQQTALCNTAANLASQHHTNSVLANPLPLFWMRVYCTDLEQQVRLRTIAANLASQQSGFCGNFVFTAPHQASLSLQHHGKYGFETQVPVLWT